MENTVILTKKKAPEPQYKTAPEFPVGAIIFDSIRNPYIRIVASGSTHNIVCLLDGWSGFSESARFRALAGDETLEITR